jgi:hypothetical protein
LTGIFSIPVTKQADCRCRPHAAICGRRAAERAALCMDTTALGIRFFNVEDVFFLGGVVIEDAAPTIRVGVDMTPPQGSDQEGNMVKKATKAKTAAKKKAPVKKTAAKKKAKK